MRKLKRKEVYLTYSRMQHHLQSTNFQSLKSPISQLFPASFAYWVRCKLTLMSSAGSIQRCGILAIFLSKAEGVQKR